MNHGEKLRKIRIRKEFSQEYVARKLGKSQKVISDLEHQEIIDDEKLNKLFPALEITKEYFENFKDEYESMTTTPKTDDEQKTIVRYLLKIVEEQTELIKKLLGLQAGSK